MINIFKKILKIPDNKLELFLKELKFDDQFISFSINKDPYLDTTNNRLLSLRGEKSRSYYLGLSSHIISSFGVTGREKKQIIQDESLLKLSNEVYRRLFSYIIERSKDYIRPASELTSDITQENRSLEWLRVSYKVLREAIHKAVKDQDLIYQGRIFFGKREPDSVPELRIQSLSIDTKLEFLADHRLRVQVWNNKNKTSLSSDAPDLFAEFVTLKGPVFDEIIYLLQDIQSTTIV